MTSSASLIFVNIYVESSDSKTFQASFESRGALHKHLPATFHRSTGELVTGDGIVLERLGHSQEGPIHEHSLFANK